MATWLTWLIASAVIVIFELFTGTLYLLMIAVGLVAGGAAAYFGANDLSQASIAGLVAAFAVLALRRSKWGKPNQVDAASDNSVNLDIGQSLHVPAWQADGETRFIARVQYRGALWDVELQADSPAKTGRCIIRAVRGSTLIVEAQ